LSVARSGVYRPPRPANDEDRSLMQRIDELFTAWPFLGSRRMAAICGPTGTASTASTCSGRCAGWASPRWGPSQERRSLRLDTRSSRISCAAWRSTGRTRCGQRASPMCRSDAASSTPSRSSIGQAGRCWRGGCRTPWTCRSCIFALEEALARLGKPEIFNTDQASQSTSAAFTGTLAAAGVRISMGRRADGWTTCSSSGCGAA
jgi:putative transposase